MRASKVIYLVFGLMGYPNYFPNVQEARRFQRMLEVDRKIYKYIKQGVVK